MIRYAAAFFWFLVPYFQSNLSIGGAIIISGRVYVVQIKLTLWLCQNSYWSHGHLKIVDLAIKNGDVP
jgi:hypothetical protein